MKKYFYCLSIMFFYVLSADALSSSEQVLFNAMTCARFEVKLPANPTTGFQWTLQKYDRERFSFEKDLYVAPETKRMGASGMHIFYFKQKENAPCPESTVLCFRHARAWESESSTCTEVTVHFSKKDLSKN